MNSHKMLAALRDHTTGSREYSRTQMKTSLVAAALDAEAAAEEMLSAAAEQDRRDYEEDHKEELAIARTEEELQAVRIEIAILDAQIAQYRRMRAAEAAVAVEEQEKLAAEEEEAIQALTVEAEENAGLLGYSMCSDSETDFEARDTDLSDLTFVDVDLNGDTVSETGMTRSTFQAPHIESPIEIEEERMQHSASVFKKVGRFSIRTLSESKPKPTPDMFDWDLNNVRTRSKLTLGGSDD